LVIGTIRNVLFPPATIGGIIEGDADLRQPEQGSAQQ